MKKFVLLFLMAALTSCENDECANSDSESHMSVELTGSKMSDSISEKRTIDSYIPENWKVHTKIWGDLNKDGVKDVVLIIQNTDKKYIVTNDGFGQDTLDCNPRKLLVLFNEKGDFKKVSENVDFIPTTNDSISPCLADPLEGNNQSIEKGVLILNFNYWLSCGSWYVTNNTFKFRFQNDRMELIGFDSESLHRASMETSEDSFNFMTMKRRTSEGGNMANDDNDNVKVTWSKIVGEKISVLDKMKSDWPQHLYK